MKLEAVAVFNSVVLSGYVVLKEKSTTMTTIEAHITGLQPNRKYGWHIHEAGDLRVDADGKPCSGACAHYNPFNKKHGGSKSRERHIGDLGNIVTDDNGNSSTTLNMSTIKLKGKYSVIGRTIVIHANEDDLGKGGTEDSMKTGSAGGRLACAVIGYSKNSLLYF
jgi:Cu-Zn family superoxide dismutase